MLLSAGFAGEMEPIDAVFSWVNGSDPAHRKLLDAYRAIQGDSVGVPPSFFICNSCRCLA